MSPSPSAWLETALEAAQAAGRHALDHRHRRHEVFEQAAHDVKLELDRECQARAVEVIRARFPRHGILGEEGVEPGAPGEPEWILDPIDGTVNFFHGLPQWCSCVGVRHEGRMMAGVVFAPEMGRCYSATDGGPALCNGAPIAPSSVALLKDALVLTGLSKHIQANPAAFDLLKELTLRSQKVRVMGSAALDICQVACGGADGYVETGIYLWDVAAAGLIAERAGACARIVEHLAPMRFRYLCANAALAPQLLEVLNQFPPGREPG